MFTIVKLERDEDILEIFDAKKVAKDLDGRKAMSKIMEYREISLRLKLSKGRYMIVPSTKTAGDQGKYFLNIYFSEGEEKFKGYKFSGYKHAKFTYVNPSPDEYTKYLKGEEIKEEDEDIKHYSDEMKHLLMLK